MNRRNYVLFNTTLSVFSGFVGAIIARVAVEKFGVVPTLIGMMVIVVLLWIAALVAIRVYRTKE